ncbi:unnamed protein product [Enterobius vermicularis]|uniref:Thioredoxin-like_fold domain-containing protein n=1 Tax=Enterobius vermicularis TaxID=51028 RepID=A0A0N4UTM2_ENTVE|nr:unnamed protein product [Enterobius vermicularis]
MKENLVRMYEELPTWGKAIFAGGAVIAIYIPFRYFTTRPRKSPIKEDYEKDVVYLYQFPRVKYVPSFSPFCLKLETWLRMADIKYENVNCGFFVRSCEGTLPFLEYNGREYPDSSLAIRDMTEIHSKESMENHLTDEQRCTARAFEKLAECSLFPTIALFRFTEFTDDFLNQMPDSYFGFLTVFVKQIVKSFEANQIRTAMKYVGIGKHSRDEVINIAADDLRAISRYLGTKHYFLGFKPSRVDATLFGVLAQIVYVPYDLPQKRLIENELTNLKEYCERMKQRFWPDWEECTTKFSLKTNYKK